MGDPSNALGEITKIGNYVVPTFGASITAALALGSIGKTIPGGHAIVVNFALYTILAAYVAYGHRLAWLRCRRAQQERGEEPSNLAGWVVILFMIVHLVLIVLLGLRLWFLDAL